HDRVDVDVHDPGVRLELLGDLVHVVLCGHAAAHVDELADSGLARQVAHRAVEEEAVLPRDVEHFGRDLDQSERRLAVDLEIVLTPHPIVVDSGDGGLIGTDFRRHRTGRSGHLTHTPHGISLIAVVTIVIVRARIYRSLTQLISYFNRHRRSTLVSRGHDARNPFPHKESKCRTYDFLPVFSPGLRRD